MKGNVTDILYLLLKILLSAHFISAFAEYNFDINTVIKKLHSSNFIEYVHIPKCGTVSRKICNQKQIPCLSLPRLRKCGHYGEHCDWLAKYNCVRKEAKITFYTKNLLLSHSKKRPNNAQE